MNVDASVATSQVAQPAPARPARATTTWPLADTGQRFAAWAIDFALGLAMLLASLAVGRAVGGTVESEVFAGLLVLVAFVLVALHEIAYPAHCGQTFGKHVLGIQIVRLDDGTARLGGGTALGRQLIKGLGTNLFGLGVLWILVDRQRQGWHDMAAGTVVVRRDQPRLDIWGFLGRPFATRA